MDEWAGNLASFLSTEALRLKYNLRAPIVHEKILAQKYFALMQKSGSLRNRFRKPADLSIFTAHNHATPSLLEQNLSFLGIEHTVLKPPLPVWSNSLRVQSFVDFLEKCSTRYVLYCDSDDVILREDPARIIEIFESHHCELLYCSTNYSAGYLNMPEVKSWVEEQHPNRYLNAGVFIGRTAFALEVYKCVLNYVVQTDTVNNPDSQALYRNELSFSRDFPKGSGCDQAILRFLEPRFSPHLQIDSDCRFAWRHGPAARLVSWLKQTYSHFVRQQLANLKTWFLREWSFFRTRSWVTRLLGFEYSISRDLIEIDLTYACNLSCNNCNRSSPQARSNEHVTLEQIQSFVAQSIATKKKWKRIRLLGGEPTLHPQFPAVLELLRRYRDENSLDTRIEVATNGNGTRVNTILSSIPKDVVVVNTDKPSTKEQTAFASFNVAPIDVESYSHADFRNGCQILKDCGVGLTSRGYYPCAIAGGIDRVVGTHTGRSQLAADEDEMRDLMDKFCRLCGHFKRRGERPIQSQLTSPTWEKLYAAYRRAVKFGEEKKVGQRGLEPRAR